MDLGKIKVNPKAIEDGVWIRLDDKTKVLIARGGNPNYLVKLEELNSKYKTKMGRSPSRQLSAEDRKAGLLMVKEAMCGTILLGWEGMEENGKDIPYTPENALRVMTDPKYIDFQELVGNLSQERENFRDEDVQEDMGKSETGSRGRKSGENTPPH